MLNGIGKDWAKLDRLGKIGQDWAELDKTGQNQMVLDRTEKDLNT